MNNIQRVKCSVRPVYIIFFYTFMKHAGYFIFISPTTMMAEKRRIIIIIIIVLFFSLSIGQRIWYIIIFSQYIDKSPWLFYIYYIIHRRSQSSSFLSPPKILIYGLRINVYYTYTHIYIYMYEWNTYTVYSYTMRRACHRSRLCGCGGVVGCEKGVHGTIYQRDRIRSRKPLESIKSIHSRSAVVYGVGGSGAQKYTLACKTLSTIFCGGLVAEVVA
jgi:hypothetical protein